MVTFIHRVVYRIREWWRNLGYRRPYIYIALALIFGFLIFVAGLIVADLTDFAIVKRITTPVKRWWEPPVASVKFDPIPNPVIIDNETSRIKVNVVNNGTKELNNIRFFYSMACVMNKPKSAVLSQHTSLESNKEDYFEFDVKGFNQDCNPSPNPVTLKFYKDVNGVLYSRAVYNIQKACLWCRLEINMTSDEYKTTYVDFYPYYDAEFDFTKLKFIPKGILPYESAPDKKDLIYLPSYDVGIFIIDLSTYCMKYQDPVCNR